MAEAADAADAAPPASGVTPNPSMPNAPGTAPSEALSWASVHFGSGAALGGVGSWSQRLRLAAPTSMSAPAEAEVPPLPPDSPLTLEALRGGLETILTIESWDVLTIKTVLTRLEQQLLPQQPPGTLIPLKKAIKAEVDALMKRMLREGHQRAVAALAPELVDADADADALLAQLDNDGDGFHSKGDEDGHSGSEPPPSARKQSQPPKKRPQGFKTSASAAGAAVSVAEAARMSLVPRVVVEGDWLHFFGEVHLARAAPGTALTRGVSTSAHEPIDLGGAQVSSTGDLTLISP